MRIRVRPKEIRIPEGDPFKNDLLKRSEPAEILTPLIDRIDGPCVMAIDGAWGTGKTTFVKMWSQYLRNKGFPVVEFNAWETDHAGDPFVAIVAELTEGLRMFEDDSVAEKRRDMVEAAKSVALRAVPAAIRILTAGVLDVQPLIEKEVGTILASYAEDRVKKYSEDQESINGFKNKLQAMATLLFCSKSHPLVVMVDELDRCRPSYAVELIEVAKHLFAADHTVFVLAVNRDQLTQSIKALYGNDFDSTGYLRRFVDFDYQLPSPDRSDFIETILDSVEIQGDVRSLMQVLWSHASFSLRQIAQSIHRIGLISVSWKFGYRSTLLTAVALFIRTVDPSLYDQFTDGRISAEDLIDSVFERTGISKVQRESNSSRHQCSRLEAIVAVAEKEIAGETKVDYSDSINSALIERHRGMSTEVESNNEIRKVAPHYSRRVISQFDHLVRDLGSFSDFGFVDCVRRIELMVRDR